MDGHFSEEEFVLSLERKRPVLRRVKKLYFRWKRHRPIKNLIEDHVEIQQGEIAVTKPAISNDRSIKTKRVVLKILE